MLRKCRNSYILPDKLRGDNMINRLKRVIFTIVICSFITTMSCTFFGDLESFAAEIVPNQDNGVENNTDIKEEGTEENKEENTEENTEESTEENKDKNIQTNEIKPSETAFVSIELLEKSKKSSKKAMFVLEFELGNELINGVEEPAIAETLYIEELDFSLPLEKLNSYITEFELSGLENKKYKYYIRSVNNQEYKGYFKINFAESDKETKPKVIFKGFPKKKVFEGTNVVIRMITDKANSKLTFNGMPFGGKITRGGVRI